MEPIRILREGGTQERGGDARLSTLVGAIAISDMVKSTLGPKGMDKILQSVSGGMRVTNDGATILKSVVVDNPAARVLIDISRVQDETVGDGTTSVCVLAGEILRQAQTLLQSHIHPMVIVDGFRRASEIALDALKKASVDNRADDKVFRENLMNVARTTLSSKVLTTVQEHFAKMAVECVLNLGGDTNLRNIQVIKRMGGTLQDSYVDDGFLLDKKVGIGCPRRIENARILVSNTAMDTDKIKILGARVRTDSHEALEGIEAAEKARMISKCSSIIDYGINVFVNRQLIYDLPMQIFAKHGVMAIEHADFDGVDRLSLVLEAELASTFNSPDLKIGHCESVSEVIIGEDRLIKFSGLPNKRASTIVLRGASMHILDEAERSLHDALCVLSQMLATESRIVLGAGAAETLMANAVEEEARNAPGRMGFVLEAYARALRSLPIAIANNGGYDGEELAGRLRALHFAGKHEFGLNMQDGSVMNVQRAGVTECYLSKQHVVLYASEAAEQILRVDSIISCASPTK
ncbi:TCP-1 chaperonin subunit beta [Giardia muris]|uniref:CCT-beta n=1 Tax=Giardia muris TaxID=5742 RepID=A0A4Z1SXG5_GIAMU|nr:TCP-1 chaperonin subunit beta [Giardia muris]|eukprot:TNJ28218.1 TCP-1 chaperonin subunit beta [Giardia muris]